MAFKYDLDVPTSLHFSGNLEVRMELTDGIFANLYEVSHQEFSDDEIFGLEATPAIKEEKEPLYCFQQDEETKQWKLIKGDPISDKDLEEISNDLTENLERWENSDW